MTAVEIILMVVGIICIIVSIIMGDDDRDKDISSVIVDAELSEQQKQHIKEQVDEIIRNEIEGLSERTEASLDKISNTKILEMNEYAENVLGEINRNHNETMFLYDMLNEKAKEVKTTVKDVNIAKRQVEKIQAEVSSSADNENQGEPDITFINEPPVYEKSADKEYRNSKDLAKERLMELVRKNKERNRNSDNLDRRVDQAKNLVNATREQVAVAQVETQIDVQIEDKIQEEIQAEVEVSQIETEVQEEVEVSQIETEVQEEVRVEEEVSQVEAEVQEEQAEEEVSQVETEVQEEVQVEADVSQVEAEVQEEVQAEAEVSQAEVEVQEETQVEADVSQVELQIQEEVKDDTEMPQAVNESQEESVVEDLVQDEVANKVDEAVAQLNSLSDETTELENEDSEKKIELETTEKKKTRKRTTKKTEQDGEKKTVRRRRTVKTSEEGVTQTKGADNAENIEKGTEDSKNSKVGIESVQFEKGATNNEKILVLNKSGFSTKEIAKQLNLGIGEVKLVLDLYGKN